MKKKSISLAHSTSKEKKALFTCLQSIVLLLVCSFLFSSSLFGQSIIGNYTFTNHGTGNGYTTIYSTGQSLYKYSNGTAPSTSTYVTLQMPFDFIYGSYKVSQGSSIAISPAWGYIFLNQNTKSNSYHPTSFTNALSPAGGNGSGYNSGYSNPGSYHYFHSQSGVYYKVDGVAPNRVLTIEFYKVSANGKANYSGYTNYTDVNSSYTKTFQVKLYETTSKIEFCYGPANAYGYNGQVSGYYDYNYYYYYSSDYYPYTFLKGATNTDSYFLYGTNSHSQYSYTGNWNNPTYTRNVDLGSHQYYYSYSGSGTSYYSYKYLYQYNEYWTNGLKYSFRAGVPTFTYSNTTGAGVELSWNPSSFNETTWSLEYGIKGFTPGSGTVVTTTNNANYLLTNLPPAAEVDIYVYAFANGPFGESTSTNKVTAITPCADNFYQPNIETFEFYRLDTINDCWRNFKDTTLIVIDTIREIVGYDTTWSYIYGDIQYIPVNFNYTGSAQTWVVPENVSSAKLEVWGAQGGYRSSSTYGGNGGYSKGNISLKAGDTLYVYVGGSGNTGGTSGGWNGGGSRSSYAGGGGGTDIRVNGNTLYHRVIVAGGGGSDGASSRGGGAGGGANGINPDPTYYGSCGYGASLSGGGSGGCASGSFGAGGAGCYSSSGYGGAGGGGWYGGGGTYPDYSGDDDAGGGGGSGYLWTSNYASYYPSDCRLTSDYYLTNTEMIAGNASMPNPSGGTMTGRTGNGYARISHDTYTPYVVPVLFVTATNLTWKTYTVEIPRSGYPSGNYYLCFTWVNNDTTGIQPPIAR